MIDNSLKQQMFIHLENDSGKKITISESTLLKLVDKATPTKPTFEGDGYESNGDMIYDVWICPRCGERYEVDYQKYDYCPNCGQAIEWSE